MLIATTRVLTGPLAQSAERGAENAKVVSTLTPKISNIYSWKFPFHLIFIPEFSVEWSDFRKFDNFRIFWNFSLELPVSKISECLVESRHVQSIKPIIDNI